MKQFRKTSSKTPQIEEKLTMNPNLDQIEKTTKSYFTKFPDAK